MKIFFEQNIYYPKNNPHFKSLRPSILKKVVTDLKPPKKSNGRGFFDFSKLKLDEGFSVLFSNLNPIFSQLAIHLAKFFNFDIVKTKDKLNTYKDEFLQPVIQKERLSELNKKTLNGNNYLQIIELLELAHNNDEFQEDINNLLKNSDNIESQIAEISSKIFEKYSKRAMNIGRIPFNMQEDYKIFVKKISDYLKENINDIDPLMLKSFIYNIGPHNFDIIQHLCSKNSCIEDLKIREILCTMLKEDVSCAGYLDFLQNNEVYKLGSVPIITLTKAYYDALRYCSPKEKSVILNKIIDLNKKINANPEKYIYNNSTSSIDILFTYCVNELAKMYYVYDDKTIEELFSKRLDNVVSFLDSFKALPKDLDLIKDLTTCKTHEGKYFSAKEKLNLARIVSVLGTSEIRQLEEMSFDGVVNLDLLKKEYFNKIFRSVYIPQNEINSMKEEKYLLWDITYLPMISQAKNGNADSFAELFKASFSDDYMKYIHNEEKEIGRVNLKTKAIFEEKGLNYEKWINPAKENEVQVKLVDQNKKRLERNVQELMENISLLRQSPLKTFFDKRYSEYIINSDFVLPKSTMKSAEKLEMFIKNLIAQMEPAWKRAKSNLENGDCEHKVYKQAANTLTIKDHLIEIQNEISKFKGIDFDRNLDLTIKMWDRAPHKDLFQGNYSTCCIALDRINGHVMPDYLLNTSLNMIEVVDNNTGKTIGNALCFFALNSENEPSFIIDNIEINNNYKLSEEASLKVLDSIKQYVSNVCNEISKEQLPLYMGKFNNDIYPQAVIKKEQLKFLGKINAERIYLDVYKGWNGVNKLKDEINLYKL